MYIVIYSYVYIVIATIYIYVFFFNMSRLNKVGLPPRQAAAGLCVCGSFRVACCIYRIQHSLRSGGQAIHINGIDMQFVCHVFVVVTRR